MGTTHLRPSAGRPRVQRNALALLAAISVLLTGCGGDSPAVSPTEPDAPSPVETGDVPADELIPVRVGTVPVISSAPLFIAVREGIFEDEGLAVETQVVQGTGPTVSAVLSGEAEFGFAATVPLMIAVSEGVPIRIVANSDDTATTEEADVSSVAVRSDSDIESILDLQGRTVATNTLNNISDLAVRTRIAQEGGDPAAVQFVEIPLPEMVGALSEGRVEAIALTEPFSTAAEAAGHVLIDRMYYRAFPAASISGFFASEAFIAANPDVVARFQRAIDRAADLARSDPAVVRQALGDFTQIPEHLLDIVRLSDFTATVNEDGIALLGDLLETYGYLDAAPSHAELVHR